MPNIVDADEDRDHVGLKSKSVLIQTIEQLAGAVSADTEIDEFKVDLGAVCRQLLCGVLGIALSQLVVISLVSTRIGDAVALKNNSYLFHSYFTISP